MPSLQDIGKRLLGESLLRAVAAAVVCAFLCSTTSTLVGVAIAGGAPELPIDPDLGASSINVDAVEQELAEKGRPAPIELEGNPFCPDCVPEPEPTAEEAPPPEPLELPLMLVATMESDDPLDSRATIWHQELDRTGVYLPHEQIMDGVTLRSVGRGVAVIEAGQAQQVLALPDPSWRAKKKKKKNDEKKPKKNDKKKSRFEIDGARDAIECKGGTCHVDRKFVNKLIKNPALLTKQARVKPWSQDGEMKGYKIYRVRKGTLPKLLGLRNGDVITSINGNDLDSMDRVMKLYAKLKNANNLEIEYQRKGKTKSATIEIS